MKESKLLKVFNAFSEEELEKLKEFLQSPYHCSGVHAQHFFLLYSAILKAAPDFEEKDVNKDSIYPLVFLDEKPVKGKLEKLMTGLFKLVEKFIQIENLDKEKYKNVSLISVAEFYRDRELFDLHEQIVKKIDRKLSLSEIRTDTFLYNQFLLAQEIENYNERYRVSSSDTTLISALKNLDNFYLYKKLSFGISLLARKVNMSIDIQDSMELIEVVLPVLEKKAYAQLPEIQALYFAFKLLYNYHNHEDDHYYFSLKEILESVDLSLDFKTKYSLQAVLRMYAIGQTNNGRLDFVQESFNLYKKHLKEGSLYYRNNLIRPMTIRTIVKIGFRLSKNDWVFNFLTEHKDRITGTPYPEDVYNINLSDYYFRIKEYEKSLDLLSFTFLDFYYKLEAKRLEIMNYYELENEFILESRIQSFKMYLIRLSKKELPEKQKRGLLNFLNLLKQIIKPKMLNNKKRIEGLLMKAQNKKVLAEKKWVIEKIQEKIIDRI